MNLNHAVIYENRKFREGFQILIELRADGMIGVKGIKSCEISLKKPKTIKEVKFGSRFPVR